MTDQPPRHGPSDFYGPSGPPTPPGGAWPPPPLWRPVVREPVADSAEELPWPWPRTHVHAHAPKPRRSKKHLIGYPATALLALAIGAAPSDGATTTAAGGAGPPAGPAGAGAG